MSDSSDPTGAVVPEPLAAVLDRPGETADLVEEGRGRRTTLDRQADGVVIASAVRDGAGAVVDFCIEYANRAAIELLGAQGTDPVGRRLLELDHVHGREHLQRLSHVVATARAYGASFQPGPDGAEVDARATKFADGVLAQIRATAGRADRSGSAATATTLPPVVRPIPFVPSTDTVPAVVFEATQALLWAECEADVARLARDLVVGLGARLVDADAGGADAVPADVSFGEARPLVPVAGAGTEERALLERYLPSFVENAHRAVALLRRTERLTEETSTDVLTGLAGRRALGRTLGRLGPGDTVLMIDLDHFRQFHDATGLHEADRVLRSFGQMLRDTTSGVAHACRYGAEEFVVVVGAGVDVTDLLARMHATWSAARPHPVTYSTGVAVAGEVPSDALAAADRALFGAKRRGRDRTEWATEEDR